MRREAFFLVILVLAAVSCKGSEGGKGGAGATKKGDNYTLTVTPPDPGKKGQPVSAVVQVLPQNGYKINLEYPTKLTVTAPTGAAPAALELRAKQATALLEHELKFRPTFTVSEAGKLSFSGKLKFSVCTDQLCHFHDEAIAWDTRVED